MKRSSHNSKQGASTQKAIEVVGCKGDGETKVFYTLADAVGNQGYGACYATWYARVLRAALGNPRTATALRSAANKEIDRKKNNVIAVVWQGDEIIATRMLKRKDVPERKTDAARWVRREMLKGIKLTAPAKAEFQSASCCRSMDKKTADVVFWNSTA